MINKITLSISRISIVHLKVHHIDQERGSHDQDFGINGESVIEVNNEVVSVGESFSEAAHPLLGDPPHLAVLRVQHSELHVTTEVDVTGRASDLQQLQTNYFIYRKIGGISLYLQPLGRTK